MYIRIFLLSESSQTRRHHHFGPSSHLDEGFCFCRLTFTSFPLHLLFLKALKLSSILWFLVADTQLYKGLCPSVRPLVRRSRSSCHARVENAKNAYLWCCSWYCLCVSVLEGGWGCGWGEAGGWMPLPTHPQQYCDHASLVVLFLNPWRALFS